MKLKADFFMGILGGGINYDVKESEQVNQENQQFRRSLIQRSPPMVTCLGQLLAWCQDRQWCIDYRIRCSGGRGGAPQPIKKKPVTDQLVRY